MDGISRISPRIIPSQPEEASSEPSVKQNSTGIAQTPDHFELSKTGSKNDLFSTAPAHVPIKATRLAANSGAAANLNNPAFARSPEAVSQSAVSALNIDGALKMLEDNLKFLKNQKSALVSKINDLSEEIAGMELSEAEMFEKTAKHGGKGAPLQSGEIDQIKAMQKELELLKSQLANVDTAINETLKKIEELKGSSDAGGTAERSRF